MAKVFQVGMVTCVKFYLVIELGKDWEWTVKFSKLEAFDSLDRKEINQLWDPESKLTREVYSRVVPEFGQGKFQVRLLSTNLLLFQPSSAAWMQV